MSFSDALVYSVVGILVVFFALTLLMVIVVLLRKFTPSDDFEQPAEDNAVCCQNAKPLAPGSAGEVKLYDTDPRDAAMIMAIVADELKKPLNELRFISIKEVKQDEV